jgi:RNA-directed DNA polymerase
MGYTLTQKRLLFDLYIAFECAKKNKSNKLYVKQFEKNLYNNLTDLCDELWGRRYSPLPSYCFIINEPKKREIFAANFRDRIVHHLYFNYVHQLFENTFIEDSYSCIKNRGTHYGIKRLEEHIRKESQNYAKECYVLKMDIRGYFIHINRKRLLEISTDVLNSMKRHKSPNGKMWEEVIDFDFIQYLNKELITLDPTINCIFRSKKEDWDGLPYSKSLFHTNENCGLPIGNLTSQLLSNVFLNVLDQYMKRELKCKHYGRYVDDFFVVSKDRECLREIIPLVKKFLMEKLDLELHMGKTKIINVKYGVEFLGAFVKPYRTYISNTTFKRMKNKISKYKNGNISETPLPNINSYLGILSHYKSFNLRAETFIPLKQIYKFGYYSTDLRKMISNDS